MDTDQIKRALDRTRADFAKVPTSEHTLLLKAIIAENDVVLGVFNDDEDPRGWSHVIIKGEQALSESVRTKTTVELKTAAIHCQEADEALAMRQVFATGGLH